MGSAAWTLLFLLVTSRGLWAIVRSILHDLRVDSLPAGEAEARVPITRKPAFRGAAPRAAARGRWEGGFGRRGL